jgi:hypothetical protein
MNNGNIGMIMQAAKNPQAFIQQAMKNNQIMQNPIARNAIEMYQRGDNDGLNNLVSNLCNERGIKPEEAIKQIKSQIGI